MVKAMFAVTKFEPETDRTYRVRMSIWTDANNASDVLNDEYFPSGGVRATVDASLTTFVKGYIQREWGVDFDPDLDSVEFLNPDGLP